MLYLHHWQHTQTISVMMRFILWRVFRTSCDMYHNMIKWHHHCTSVNFSTTRYTADPPKCIDYRIMLHCGNEFLPFHSHIAAVTDNRCILGDQQNSVHVLTCHETSSTSLPVCWGTQRLPWGDAWHSPLNQTLQLIKYEKHKWNFKRVLRPECFLLWNDLSFLKP